MQYFPQLLTGAVGQYPIEKTEAWRTIVNELIGGAKVSSCGEAPASVAWTLGFQALSDQERANLEALFVASEGRLGRFCFLDPTQNLLLWTEELQQPCWAADPGLVLTSGAPDPDGGTRGTRIANQASAVQRIEQWVSAPGWFTYCYSVTVRALWGSAITMLMRTDTGQIEQVVAAGGQWARYRFTGNLGKREEGVRFGLELGPGTVVEVFGPQAEAQILPSPYQQNGAAGGVYVGARFADDYLELTTVAPGLHEGRIRLVAQAG